MAVDECTKFLMDAVPLPESLAEDCAHFKVRNITICKGVTRDTHDTIAVWTCPAGGPGRCMQRRTQKLPKTAQDVLRPLYSMFKGIVTERAKFATNSPEYRCLTQQYDEVIRRRNMFSQQLRNGEFELVAAHRVQKRVAVDDAEEQTSRDAKKAKHHTEDALAQSEDEGNGKGKNKASNAPRQVVADSANPEKPRVAQDQYDPQSYEVDPDQSRDITIILYNKVDSLPLSQPVQLRHASCVDLSSMDFAAKWFCMFERCFLPKAFSTPINMLSHGNILVCRAAIILEDECPGLQAYITEAYLSVATLAAAFVADEEDTVAIEVLGISPPSSLVVSASTAASSSSAPAVVGPSRLSPPPVAGPLRLTSFQAHPYEATRTLSATPLQAATFFMSDNSPPHTSDSSPPDTSDSSPPDMSIDDGVRHIWSFVRANKKNRQDPELAKRSDEITKYLCDVCYPQIAQWEASKGDKDKRTRKDYIEQMIYPDIDEKFDISGPNGFKIQDFQDTIVQSFKNWIRVERNKGQLPDPAPAVHDADEPAVLVHSGPAPRVRRKTAKDMFRKENKDEISRVAKAENKGAKREVHDGLELTTFGRLLEERWAACSETEKERLEEKARAHNEGLKITTEETLAKNQEYLNNHVYDALRRLIGFGPKQAGKCCFFVRTVCVQPDGTIKFRRISIYEGKTKGDFKPVDDGEVTAFKDWATSKLSNGGDLPETSLDMDDLLTLPPEEPLALDTELKLTAPPAAPAHTKTADDNEDNTEDFSLGLVKAVASTAAEANAASGSSTSPNAPSTPPLDAQAPSGDLREASMDIDILLRDDNPLSLPPGSIVLDDEFGMDSSEGELAPPLPPTPPVTGGQGGLAPPPPPTPSVTGEGGLASPASPTAPVTGSEGGLAVPLPPTPVITGEGRLASPEPPTPPITGSEGGLAAPLPPTPIVTGEGGLAPPGPPTPPITGEGGPAYSDVPVLPPAAARKRGRPPRAVPPAVPVDNKDTPSAPAPKKRGRPPKKVAEKGKAPAKKASGAAAKRKAPDTGADPAPTTNKRQRVVVIPEGGIRRSTREGRGENNAPRPNL
ncbi:hypothetical protein B0H13DRAFT_2317219 [Mycena leptocephala]|nr:hypothetical protein B0H13DRAFT_2317219 [Mycena leptocephala]